MLTRSATVLTLANIYSNPKHNGQKFKTLFGKIKAIKTKAERELAEAGSSLAVICGDFNAPHEELGYTRTTTKGRDLLDAAAKEDFVLSNDPNQHTRIGTSTVRDTTPDLAFTSTGTENAVEWRNTGENLGSDHYILELEIRLNDDTLDGGRRREHKSTNWDDFRRIDLGKINDIEEWNDRIRKATERSSSTIEGEEEIELIDSRLAHLMDARRSLQKRWRKQRHNRKLRKKIAELGREIGKHSRYLCNQQWSALCSRIDGQLHRSSPWKILRQLMDETKSREFQSTRLTQILHSATRQFGQEETHRRLQERYLPELEREDHGRYGGRPNAHLDKDIEEWEVRAAMQDLNNRSAAGPDKITNKMLRNLGDQAVTELTEYYNKCWRSGSLPRAWKTARTILLPKPNKPPDIENLRPISLTSCVGKMLEHILNNRWNDYMERHRLFPDSMLGFRAHLGTQDAMLRIQREVLDPPEGLPKMDNRAILCLDLQGAFDNVKHRAILDQVSRLDLGERTFNFIRDFLSDRTARLEVGGEQLDERRLGSVGTPQGSVISPFLFNIVMIEVAERLERLDPGIRHCLYADDVTIWVTGGNDGDIEAGLQEAVKIVETTLEKAGLKCSPQKSQLLVLAPPGRARKSAQLSASKNIVIRTSDGSPISHAPGVRILGMFVDGVQTNTTAAKNIVTKIGIATRLVKRVSSRYRGMNERGLLRLLQAFVNSQVAYAGAFHRWTKAEEDKIDAAIRKAFRGALGLLPGTKNSALLSLGVHNTLAEISEAQRTAQLHRLNSTTTGRNILDRVKLRPPPAEEDPETIDDLAPIRDEIARGMIVYPIPKNMDPHRDQDRRRARAKALARLHAEDARAAYVDAAKHPTKPRTYTIAVVRASTGETINAATVRASAPHQAEEAAISLAMGVPNIGTVLSDSKTAIRNFARGTIWKTAERLAGEARKYRSSRLTSSTTIIKWFPGHEGDLPGRVNCNESADARARELGRCRDSGDGQGAGDEKEVDTRPLTGYREILERHRTTRGQYPKPHGELSRAETVLLRQLQVRCVLTPALARHICPDMYTSDVCSVCESAIATLEHILRCNGPTNQNQPGASESGGTPPLRETTSAHGAGVRNSVSEVRGSESVLTPEMERWIRSNDKDNQIRAIRRVEGALARQRRQGPQSQRNGTPRALAPLAGPAFSPRSLGPGASTS